MAEATKPFKTFEKLRVYEVAREFRKAMYRVSGKLPESEKFGLESQIRRAAVSLTNNIAEGHGRYHFLDQIRFMLQARGSLEELIDDLKICADEKYIALQEADSLKQHGWRVYQLLNGYIRFLRERKAGANLEIHESVSAFGSEKDLDLLYGDLPNEQLQSGADPTVQRFNGSTT